PETLPGSKLPDDLLRRMLPSFQLVPPARGPGGMETSYHVDQSQGARPRGLMMVRYQQYTDAAQIGPVIAIDIDEWVGWQARE
ncbi:MAG TPA: hypothetical protein VIP78_08710, partial [Candidatus Dormibacteraeota bacterium]